MLIVAGAVVIAGISLAELESRETIGHALFIGASILWAAYTVALRKAHLDGPARPGDRRRDVAGLLSSRSTCTFAPQHLLAAPVKDLLVQGVYQGVLTAVVSMVLYSLGVALLGAVGRRRLRRLRPGRRRAARHRVLGERTALHDWIAIAIITLGVLLASGAFARPKPQPT